MARDSSSQDGVRDDFPIADYYSAEMIEVLRLISLYLKWWPPPSGNGAALTALATEDASPPQPGGVVFLLGAGCSMQYGFPSFKELLSSIARDPEIDFSVSAADGGSFADLRLQQEILWSGLGAEEKRRVLERHMPQVEESSALGYRYLAALFNAGFVRAIVTMNFDLLLEKAIEEDRSRREEQGLPAGVLDAKSSTSDITDRQVLLDDEPRIYKLHGSLKEAGGEPVIAMGDSEFFKGGEWDLAKLLDENHVVMLGYSGEDADLRNALRGVREGAGSRYARLLDLMIRDRTVTDVIRDAILEHRDHILERAEELDRPSEDPKKLFIFQVGRINPQLKPLIQARNSEYLTISGREASFETVMEGIWQFMVRDPQARGRLLGPVPSAGDLERSETVDPMPVPIDPGDLARQVGYFQRSPFEDRGHPAFMTNAEQAGLSECLDMALDIRARINVAEVSRISIDGHAREIFADCLKLARFAGVGLTSVEKYLLYCASILHDLGYFEGYSRGEVARGRGWRFLHQHGERTARLLEEFRQDEKHAGSVARGWQTRVAPWVHHDPVARIYPRSYGRESWELFWDLLVTLCHCHALPLPRDQRPEIASRDQWVVVNDEFRCRVRFPLIHSLFAAVEEISGEHPFLPSTDPPQARLQETRRPLPAIEDPILDLYLRRKDNLLEFRLRDRKVVVDPPRALGRRAIRWEREGARHTRHFLLCLASVALGRFEEEARRVHQSSESGVPPGGDPQRRGEARVELAISDVWEGAPSVATILAAESAPGCEIDYLGMVTQSLGESLQEHLARLAEPVEESRAQGEGEGGARGPRLTSEHLDLLAIFCLELRKQERRQGESEALDPSPVDGFDEYRRRWSRAAMQSMDYVNEPRVDLGTPKLHELFSGATFREPSRKVLLEYLKLKSSARREPQRTSHHDLLGFHAGSITLDPELRDSFLDSFETIIHPAWRFCAQRWREGKDAINMARVSLDLGSTGLRGEFEGGVRHLVANKIHWHPERPIARGHDDCIICSSRLLYILTHLRLSGRRDFGTTRFRARSEAQAELLASGGTKTLDECLHGLVAFLLEKRSKAEWWGTTYRKQESAGHSGRARVAKQREKNLESADYLSWAVRSLIFLAATDQGEPIAGLQRRKVDRRLGSLWRMLTDATPEQLLSPNAEEPHSFILGEVATTLLILWNLQQRGLFPERPLLEPLRKDSAETAKLLASLRAAQHKLSQNEAAEGGQASAATPQHGPGVDLAHGVPDPVLSQFSRFYLLPLKIALIESAEVSGLSQSVPQLMATVWKETLECGSSRIWIRDPEDEDFGSWGYNTENTARLVSILSEAWWHILKYPDQYSKVMTSRD